MKIPIKRLSDFRNRNHSYGDYIEQSINEKIEEHIYFFKENLKDFMDEYDIQFSYIIYTYKNYDGLFLQITSINNISDICGSRYEILELVEYHEQ